MAAKLGALGQLPCVHACGPSQMFDLRQSILVESKTNGSPHSIGGLICRNKRLHARYDARPLGIHTILFVTGLIPTIDTPVDLILMIHRLAQRPPPFVGFMTAVGYDHQMYTRIYNLEPLTDFQKFSAVDGITIIAAESDLLYLHYHICTDLLLEETQV